MLHVVCNPDATNVRWAAKKDKKIPDIVAGNKVTLHQIGWNIRTDPKLAL